MLDIKVDDFLDFTEKMQNLEDILQSYIPSDEDLDLHELLSECGAEDGCSE